MKYLYIFLGLILLAVGSWVYMKNNCGGLYYEQEYLQMVQDSSGVHEVAKKECFAPFQKFPNHEL